MSDNPASSHDTADWFEQRGFDLRFGWGPNGLRRLAPGADSVVIVDVLSFSTAVDVALGRGAVVLPYRWHDGTEQAYAEANDAELATRRPEPGRLSLRPSSLLEAPAGLRLVLPSPNGSALTFAAADVGATAVMVGSLRNAGAVGRAVAAKQGTVAVIAAGERWRGVTGPLRPAIEDMLGAGAILAAIAAAADPASPRLISPEARTAMAAFNDAAPELSERLRECGSGRELIDKGFPLDVELAAKHDASGVVPTLEGIELVDASASP
ncbi:MAG: 2-phosphosulfolactate phosphatase [Acidimicrobiales bacterium]